MAEQAQEYRVMSRKGFYSVGDARSSNWTVRRWLHQRRYVTRVNVPDSRMDDCVD